MMCKTKILFFAADPTAVLSSGRTAALQTGEDARQIQERVHAAKHGRMLDFDWRFAARTSDLPRALRQTPARVVHFSGHGSSQGLVLTDPSGSGAQHTSPEAVKRVFETFRHKVRLVVLSACHSRDQAEAIKEVVGCAIGIPGKIPDEAAILFNAAFYSAIAHGESVQDAFDQALAELGLNQFPGARPELHVRDDVNPRRLFLVPRFCKTKMLASATALSLTAAAVIVSYPPPLGTGPEPLYGVQLGNCSSAGNPHSPAGDTPMSVSGTASQAEADLAQGKSFCAARNYEAAVSLFRRAADAGNVEAMGLLGIAFLTGEGIAPEPGHGIDLLRKASGVGKRDRRAMKALAAAYLNGYGVDRNDYYAKYWYGVAVDEHGDVEAMGHLASLYLRERNDSALILLQKADSMGSMEARVDLAEMYEHGIGVPRDVARALRLYQSAAEAGWPSGLLAMGRIYQEGRLVRRDYALARELYQRAICAGSADAMNSMGALYQNGWGVPRDEDEAIRWFRKAEAAGAKGAAANLAKLEEPEQPREWEGPVGKVLTWLRLGPSEPRLGCTVPHATGSSTNRVVITTAAPRGGASALAIIAMPIPVDRANLGIFSAD